MIQFLPDSAGMSGWLLTTVTTDNDNDNVCPVYAGSAHPDLIDVLGAGHQGRGLVGAGHQPHPLTLSPQIGGVDRQ